MESQKEIVAILKMEFFSSCIAAMPKCHANLQ